MSTIAEKLYDIEYYELNELSKVKELPYFVVTKAIERVVEQVVEDPAKVEKLYPGIKEITENFKHASIDSPQIILIKKELGKRVVVNIFNEIDEAEVADETEADDEIVGTEEIDEILRNLKTHGRGMVYIEDAFGPAYTSEINGNVYHGRLVIESKKKTEPHQQLTRAA